MLQSSFHVTSVFLSVVGNMLKQIKAANKKSKTEAQEDRNDLSDDFKGYKVILFITLLRRVFNAAELYGSGGCCSVTESYVFMLSCVAFRLH